MRDLHENAYHRDNEQQEGYIRVQQQIIEGIDWARVDILQSSPRRLQGDCATGGKCD